MSESPDFDAVTDAESFEGALDELLHAAGENGVDIEGSYICHRDQEHHCWEVQFVRLQQPRGSTGE